MCVCPYTHGAVRGEEVRKEAWKRIIITGDLGSTRALES